MLIKNRTWPFFGSKQKKRRRTSRLPPIDRNSFKQRNLLLICPPIIIYRLCLGELNCDLPSRGWAWGHLWCTLTLCTMLDGGWRGWRGWERFLRDPALLLWRHALFHSSRSKPWRNKKKKKKKKKRLHVHETRWNGKRVSWGWEKVDKTTSCEEWEKSSQM